MKSKPSIGLMVVLMMFPQIIETIYSPALPAIAQGFGVPMALAGETLSIYFLAFAFGVVGWGIAADKLGRRKAMLAGLAVYAFAAIGALYADNFTWLLAMRALSAFGAAVGSVVTQTILRDSFSKQELSTVFSYMGIGIAISPALGLLIGSVLASRYSYHGVFVLLAMLALMLLLLSLRYLKETQPKKVPTVAGSQTLLSLAGRMIKDAAIWRSAVVVCGFNIMLFSYYLHGPFLFAKLGFSSMQFGLSGLVLASATIVGSQVNKHLLRTKRKPTQIIQLASWLSLLGAIGVYILGESVLILLPIMLVVIGFSLAIPNVLAGALHAYQAQVGSAGALFGLSYYLMIGFAMTLVAKMGDLGLVLLIVSLMMVVISAINHCSVRGENCNKPKA